MSDWTGQALPSAAGPSSSPAQSSARAATLSPQTPSISEIGRQLGVRPQDRPTFSGVDVKVCAMTETFASPSIANGHQGYTWTGTHHLVIDTAALYKYDANWGGIVQSNADPFAGTVLTHFGDGNCAGGKLYITAEIYNTTSWSDMSLLVFDAATLERERIVDVTAQGYEISGCCAVPELGEIFVVSFVGNTSIWRYRLSDFAYLGKIDPDIPIALAQGITYRGGYFHIMSDSSGKISEVSLAGKVTAQYQISGRNTNFEGLEWVGDELRWLNDDPTATPPRRVFYYKFIPTAVSALRTDLLGGVIAEKDFRAGGKVFGKGGLDANGDICTWGYPRVTSGGGGTFTSLAVSGPATINGVRNWGKLSAAPTVGVSEGDWYYDSTLKRNRTWDGSQWNNWW